MKTSKLLKTGCLVLLSAFTFLTGCKKETEIIAMEPVSAYSLSGPGKYIIYRVDSTVVVSFGTSLRVNSYNEKHEADKLTTDNMGRPALRVFRYQRDTANTKPWAPVGSYFITALDKTVEVVENNLRYVKLALPLREGFSWQGNRFLPGKLYGGVYDFSIDNGMDAWDFTYGEVDGETIVRGKPYQYTVTVKQADDVTNFPLTTDSYGSKIYSKEVYAKGLGLIYQELAMLEYQAPPVDRPGYRGFGIKRAIISHN